MLGDLTEMAARLRTLLSEDRHLTAEFHPTKNAPLTPGSVSRGSGTPLWWQCTRGHVWKDTAHHRMQGRTCRTCAIASRSLALRYPRIAKAWHPTKNGTLTPRDVGAGSDCVVWWVCPKAPDHVWQAGVQYRIGRGCPFCAGRRACASNSFATRCPETAREWHPTKNKRLTAHQVVPGSHRRAWWRCPEGHEWETTISNRVHGRHNCPTCAGQRVTRATSLASRAPGVVPFWHPTKNLLLTPWDVSLHSGRRRWWRCAEGPDHEWEGAITDQAGKGGRCPFCSGKRLSVTNCLATCYPRVAAEWHPTKNGSLTPRDILRATGRKVCGSAPSAMRGRPSCATARRTAPAVPFAARRGGEPRRTAGAPRVPRLPLLQAVWLTQWERGDG